jgi:NADP-dependent 3-hydroxy acid dehydrogenase YdfG
LPRFATMSSIRGKLIGVTGAASGIGRATCELLAKNGAALSMADMDREAVEHFANGLKDQKTELYWKQVDVREREEAETWVAETVKKFGRPLDGG